MLFKDIVTHIECHGVERLITLIRSPTWLGRLFGIKTAIKRYRGSGMTWYIYPGHERASPTVELVLAKLYVDGKLKP